MGKKRKKKEGVKCSSSNHLNEKRIKKGGEKEINIV